MAVTVAVIVFEVVVVAWRTTVAISGALFIISSLSNYIKVTIVGVISTVVVDFVGKVYCCVHVGF